MNLVAQNHPKTCRPVRPSYCFPLQLFLSSLEQMPPELVYFVPLQLRGVIPMQCQNRFQIEDIQVMESQQMFYGEKTVESNPKNITVHWNLCVLFVRIVLLVLARSSFLTRGYTVCKGWYIKWWDDQKCWKTSFQIEDNAYLTS